MKKLLLILSISVLTYSCCKKNEELVITETDAQGKIIAGDTNQGKFSMWNVDSTFAKSLFL